MEKIAQENTRVELNLLKGRMLIIGGSGFIGNALAGHSNLLGFNVTSVSLSKPKNIQKGVEYLVGDISDLNCLKALFKNREFEYIINCGGHVNHSHFSDGGRGVIQTHFNGILNLLDSINKSCLRRFVQIGSGDEYGLSNAQQEERIREAPISPYSLGKVATTHFLQMMWITEAFPAVILRLFLVYGPGQSNDRLVPQIIKGCLSRESFPVSGGAQLRDFCYIDDIVEGIIRALVVPNICGKIINLASSVPVSVREVIEKIRGIIGSGEPLYGSIPYRTAENMMLWANIELANELLGWAPLTGLDEGLKKTIDFMKNKNPLRY